MFVAIYRTQHQDTTIAVVFKYIPTDIELLSKCMAFVTDVLFVRRTLVAREIVTL